MEIRNHGRLCRADAEQSEESWMQRELVGCEFRDERLGERFSMVLRQLSEGTAESIPLACQDWANAEAAYRFFSNERVSEVDILSGHFRSTRERFAGTGGTVLVLHDTTVFSYMRENVGVLHKPKHGPSDRWRQQNPLCGISMHSSLAITEAGLPLGLAAVKFWTRKEFKGTNALKRKVNPTRVPIGEKEGRAERVRPLIADSIAGHGLDLPPVTRSHLMAFDAREPGILPTGARLRMQKDADPALAHESIWPQILLATSGKVPRSRSQKRSRWT